jgi:hypothetical protein
MGDVVSMHSDGDGGAPLPAMPAAMSKINATVTVVALTYLQQRQQPLEI